MQDELNSEYNPEEEPEEGFYGFLRAHEHRLELEASSMPEAETPTEKAMVNHLKSTMMDMLTELRAKREPDQVFAAALQGLGKMQQEQFILENILESLKRGEPLDTIMNRFSELGLVPAQESSRSPATDNPDQDNPESYKGPGGFFMRVRSKLARSSMILTKVALKAAQVAKAAGKFAEVVPVIGFVGPVPTINLQLQPKGVAVDELIDLVIDSLK